MENLAPGRVQYVCTTWLNFNDACVAFFPLSISILFDTKIFYFTLSNAKNHTFAVKLFILLYKYKLFCHLFVTQVQDVFGMYSRLVTHVFATTFGGKAFGTRSFGTCSEYAYYSPNIVRGRLKLYTADWLYSRTKCSNL